MKYPFILSLITAILILLFTYTAVSKLIHPAALRHTINHIPLLQGNGGWLSISVPVTELCVTALLLSAPHRHTGLLLSFFLLAAFTAVLMMTLFTTEHLPCSCGGIIQQLSWPQHILLNAVLMGMAFVGWRKEKYFTQKNINAH